MIDKYVSQRIRADIRNVLIEVWDPIGVSGIPEARDEYDSYLGEVFHLLVTGATDDQISEYLLRQMTAHMGLSGATKGALQPTIAALRKIPLPADSN